MAESSDANAGSSDFERAGKLTHSAVAGWVRAFACAETEGWHSLEGVIPVAPQARLQQVDRTRRDALGVWRRPLHGAKRVRRRIAAHRRLDVVRRRPRGALLLHFRTR